jgi:hypothetical protein
MGVNYCLSQTQFGPSPSRRLPAFLAGWLERFVTDDASSIHVSEKLRLPPMYTDAMADTGCDTNTEASRREGRGTLAVVATVTP